jgi:alpha-aminoadipic semialdehyde synthase
MVQPEDYLVHKQGKPFQFDHYLKCPDEYESLFHERVAPYSSMIINGVLWNEAYPRLMTIEQTKNLAKQNRLRLHSLADISCDIRVSLTIVFRQIGPI